MTADRPPFLAIAGPTGVGKTALSLEIAERWGGEIVSVDSRQVYRGLDIGTAKPMREELDRVPHHFIDELPLGTPFSAGQFADRAADRIDEIVSRGRVPIAVGGSTLYLEALVHGLAPVPAVALAVRQALAAESAREGGPQRLFEELRAADPTAAASLDPTKSARLERFVGVLRTTGRPPSSFWAEWVPPRHRFRVVVLTRSRGELYRRIEQRVDKMLADGLVGENRRLRDAHGTSSALRTIGYAEPQRYLTGELDYEAMVEAIKRNTRRYAKRQLTWFRRHPDYVWLDAATTTASDVIEG